MRAVPCALARRLRERAFTLVEMMVSLTIGFIVVGALLASYLAAARTGGATDAMQQMTEDATEALSVMRTQVAMAGFATPNLAGGPLALRGQITPMFGCDKSAFADLASKADASLACAGKEDSDTLEVAYEAVAGADASAPSNAILDSTGAPLDCIGNAIPAEEGVNPPLHVNDSKFFVVAKTVPPTLNCYAHGAKAGAPLVDNIERLEVTYGFNDSRVGAPSNQIVAYGPAPPWHDAHWDHVVAVTLCVQVRSAGQVIGQSERAALGNYVDCGGQARSSSDGYMRRTFATTVVLQNALL